MTPQPLPLIAASPARTLRTLRTLRTFVFWSLLVALVVARLWINSDEEVVASTTPYDAYWTVKVADRGYWGPTTHDKLTLIRPPAYVLWLSAVRDMGIPQRIAIELAFISATLFLAFAVCRAGVSRWLGLLLIAIILSDAHPFRIFRWTLTDSLNIPIAMALAASLLMLALRADRRSGWLWGMAAGFFAGAYALNRSEGQMLAMGGIVIAGGFALLLTFFRAGWRPLPRLGAVQILAPLLVCLTLVAAAKAANYHRFGVYAVDELRAPGWAAANKALYRIKPPELIDHVSLTQAAMADAAAVSPTFATIHPLLQGEVAEAWNRVGANSRKVPAGEVLTGYHGWALRDAAYRVGKFETSGQHDAFWAQVAAELNTAINEGRVQTRFVPSPYFDPGFENWLPRVPAATKAMWQLIIARGSGPLAFSGDDANTPDIARDFYDRVTLRRTTLASKPPSSATGHVTSTLGTIARIEVWGNNGLNHGVTKTLKPRPDNPTQLDFAFFGRGLRADTPVTWRIIHTDGRVIPVRIPFGQTGEAKGKHKDGAATLFIAAATPDTVSTAPALARRFLWNYQGYLIEYLMYVTAAALLITLITFRRQPAIFWIVVIALAAISIPRFALFILVDASAWRANQPRYVYPAVPVLFACGIVILHFGLLTLRTWLVAVPWTRLTRGRTASLPSTASPDMVLAADATPNDPSRPQG